MVNGRRLKYREALRQALTEEMAADERVFVFGEDVGNPFGGTDNVTMGLWKKFGEQRVRNAPISENALMGAALGAALLGMRPVVEIMYVDFLTLAMDQLVNQTAKIRYMSGGQVTAPLVVRTHSGSGRSAAAQHSQCLESWLVHVPGLKVVMPSNAYNAKGLLKSSIRDDNPVVFVEQKLLYNTAFPVPEEEYLIPLGKADIAREGTDLSIVSLGMMTSKALRAADILADEGISAEVIDLLSLSPIDTQTILQSVRKTGKLMITHEAVAPCGIGAEVAAIAANEAFFDLKAPIERVTSKFSPSPFSPDLERYVLPSEQDIVAAARKLSR